MKTYWAIVCGCAAFLLLPLAAGPLLWQFGIGGPMACLLAGVAGTRLAPRVPVLREVRVRLSVSIIVLGGVVQGAGLFSQLGVLWAAGLFLTLALPLAGLAYDTQQDEAEYRHLLSL